MSLLCVCVCVCVSRFKLARALSGVCVETGMVGEEEINQLLKIEEFPHFMMGQVHTIELHNAYYSMSGSAHTFGKILKFISTLTNYT